MLPLTKRVLLRILHLNRHFLARVVSTHPLLVSTQCFKPYGKMMKKRSSVSTKPQVVSTLDPVPKEPSWQCVDTASSSVDTGDPSQRTNSASLGQCVDTLLGQVDTLRKLFYIKFHRDTWHPRVHMDRSWIMCPRPPRVRLDTLGYKYPPIGHPTQENFSEPSRNPFAARSVLLPVLALLVLPQANSHLSKHEKWSLIIEDAIGSLQGSRSSRGSQLRRLQGRSQSSSCRASGQTFSCKGSVDTPPTGVDTMLQTLRQNDEEKVKCVDTASSGVDTRSSSQRT
ncbi:hypothetical protein Taro_043168 [Colocasia esculenta]|uniref:Uncharacterized protein n=1 Tax=Colocasia esculenta TaxID=4460 RepID=A0A843WRE2_COLES|nr:hypothetical protein [Colocasia esculenta]